MPNAQNSFCTISELIVESRSKVVDFDLIHFAFSVKYVMTHKTFGCQQHGKHFSSAINIL